VLPPVTSTEAAISDAALLYPELGTKTVYTTRQTDGDTDAAFANAAFTIAGSGPYTPSFPFDLLDDVEPEMRPVPGGLLNGSSP
jgi:hypothetical protein